MTHSYLGKFFDAPIRERMSRSTRVLTDPANARRTDPIWITTAHPRTAHKAFVAANERHNGLKDG